MAGQTNFGHERPRPSASFIYSIPSTTSTTSTTHNGASHPDDAAVGAFITGIRQETELVGSLGSLKITGNEHTRVERESSPQVVRTSFDQLRQLVCQWQKREDLATCLFGKAREGKTDEEFLGEWRTANEDLWLEIGQVQGPEVGQEKLWR